MLFLQLFHSHDETELYLPNLYIHITEALELIIILLVLLLIQGFVSHILIAINKIKIKRIIRFLKKDP